FIPIATDTSRPCGGILFARRERDQRSGKTGTDGPRRHPTWIDCAHPKSAHRRDPGVNITYIVTRAHPIGGVQIHVRDLAVSLTAQGHTCTVVTGGTGLFVDMLRAERIPTVILRHLIVPIHPVRDMRALGEIRATLQSLRPDLVAAHSSKAGILTRI